jgi:hypothetical protein
MHPRPDTALGFGPDLCRLGADSQIKRKSVPYAEQHVVLGGLNDVSVELHVMFCKSDEVATSNAARMAANSSCSSAV